MIGFTVPAADIVNATATATTAGIVTIPGGRYLTANIQISATVAVAGTAAPVVTYKVTAGTNGAAPANNSILARVVVTGLIGSASSASSTTEVLVYGGDNGCTIDFTAGASGSSAVTINGILI